MNLQVCLRKRKIASYGRMHILRLLISSRKVIPATDPWSASHAQHEGWSQQTQRKTFSSVMSDGCCDLRSSMRYSSGLYERLFRYVDGHTTLSSLAALEFWAFHKLSTIHQPLHMRIPCHRLDTSHCQRHRLLILWMLRRFCWERPLDWLSYLWSNQHPGIAPPFLQFLFRSK